MFNANLTELEYWVDIYPKCAPGTGISLTEVIPTVNKILQDRNRLHHILSNQPIVIVLQCKINFDYIYKEYAMFATELIALGDNLDNYLKRTLKTMHREMINKYLEMIEAPLNE